MAYLNNLLLGLVTWAMSHVRTSGANNVIFNSADGTIYMDSFVAHEKFYSSLQALIRTKIKFAIEDIMAHSKVEVTQLVPNINVMEYTQLQIIHFLAHSDLPFVNQLVQSYESANEEHSELMPRTVAMSDFVKSNIVYPPSEMYKVVKSLMNVEHDKFNNIPKPIEEGIMSVMNKSEIFTEASRMGDIDVMKLLLISENCCNFSAALETACLQKRLDIVKFLIENDLSNTLEIVNSSNCDKETLLHISVLTQSRRFLLLLIKGGVSVNVTDTKGFPPLYLAVRRNDLFMSQLLIEAGANVNQETSEGNTALHEASGSGHVDIAQLLVDSGSDPLHKNKLGISPVIASEKFIITNIIRYLFNHKVNIPEGNLARSLFFMLPGGLAEAEPEIDTNNILRNSKLVNLMKSSVVGGSFEEEGVIAKLLNITLINLITPLVESLINLGVGLDIESEATKDIFLNSIERGNGEMTLFLLNKGISVNTTREGRSALHAAAMNGRTKLFNLLVQRGADVLAERSNGRTMLHSACEGGQKAIVEYLLNRGVDVNATDTDSISPLQIAAYNGDYDTIATLVRHGADVRFRSSTTALLAATISGNVKAVKLLLDKGADIEEKANFKMTPLMAAVEKGDEAMAETLLARGASPQTRDGTRGDTALHMAARRGSLEMVQLLMKQGGEAAAVRNSDGRTALDEAIAKRRAAIVSLLLEGSGASGARV